MINATDELNCQAELRDGEQAENAPRRRWPLASEGGVELSWSHGGKTIQLQESPKGQECGRGSQAGLEGGVGGRGHVVEKLSNPTPTPCIVWVMPHDSLATKPFPGKEIHFLKGQAVGQWLSTEAFPNLPPKSQCAMLSPRAPCSMEGC